MRGAPRPTGRHGLTGARDDDPIEQRTTHPDDDSSSHVNAHSCAFSCGAPRMALASCETRVAILIQPKRGGLTNWDGPNGCLVPIPTAPQLRPPPLLLRLARFDQRSFKQMGWASRYSDQMQVLQTKGGKQEEKNKPPHTHTPN